MNEKKYKHMTLWNTFQSALQQVSNCPTRHSRSAVCVTKSTDYIILFESVLLLRSM